ncbi:MULTISPECIES: hypothetical protein [unclassified Spirillospora]|uniref:hypothetical protein n=1 Tax=unclassified Spirillospora TaxID=2642701 RepID=UPI00371D4A3D
MTPRRRHGQAGLLAILFVVGGLIFSYGLGHAPVPRVCTEHAVSVPAGVASSITGVASLQGSSPLQDVHGSAEPASAAPLKQKPPLTPMNAGLCLAVLFTLVLLALATGLGRPVFRLPARVGWALAPPSRGASTPTFRRSLQVLRL